VGPIGCAESGRLAPVAQQRGQRRGSVQLRVALDLGLEPAQRRADHRPVGDIEDVGDGSAVDREAVCGSPRLARFACEEPAPQALACMPAERAVGGP
jgi:hypothetical protein